MSPIFQRRKEAQRGEETGPGSRSQGGVEEICWTESQKAVEGPALTPKGSVLGPGSNPCGQPHHGRSIYGTSGQAGVSLWAAHVPRL